MNVIFLEHVQTENAEILLGGILVLVTLDSKKQTVVAKVCQVVLNCKNQRLIFVSFLRNI